MKKFLALAAIMLMAATLTTSCEDTNKKIEGYTISANKSSVAQGGEVIISIVGQNVDGITWSLCGADRCISATFVNGKYTMSIPEAAPLGSSDFYGSDINNTKIKTNTIKIEITAAAAQ